MTQWREWQEFSAREPLGFAGADLLNSLACATFARALGGGDVTPASFSVLAQHEEQPEPAPEEERAFVAALLGLPAPARVSASGAKIADDGHREGPVPPR